jgi:hypothetical protein
VSVLIDRSEKMALWKRRRREAARTILSKPDETRRIAGGRAHGLPDGLVAADGTQVAPSDVDEETPVVGTNESRATVLRPPT